MHYLFSFDMINVILYSFPEVYDMCKEKRPLCFGMYDTKDDCETCKWQNECQAMTKNIDSAFTRGGTHIRIVSKYKEKKYKPKRK